MTTIESNESRIIGPPGTGKTTRLAQVLDNCARRYGSDNVVAVSHTNAAAREIVGRNTLVPSSNVGTIHAMAYRSMGVRMEVAQTARYLKQFAEETGYRINPNMDEEAPLYDTGSSEVTDDQLMGEYSRLRNMEVPREMWSPDVAMFAKKWEQFKANTGTIDFVDMLDYALDCEHAPGNPSAMIVDEMQDSTRKQLRLLRQWGRSADTFVCAGDPDQAIYEWAGADPTVFLTHRPARQEILAQSYRVPKKVHRLAARWIARITEREQVEYMPTDEEGALEFCPATFKYPEPLVDRIEADLAAGHTVMVQAMCGYMLDRLIAVCRRLGIPFGNRWRRKNGAWNPLAHRSGNCTVSGVCAYLEPWVRNDDRAWSVKDVQLWTKMLKGVFRRGMKDALDELHDTASQADVLCTLMGAMENPEKLERLLLCGNTNDAMRWFVENVKADRAKLVQYIAAVVARYGATALAEEPKLCIGTIHSVKGGEADSVYVFPDLPRAGWEQWVYGNQDPIIRTMYVAYTRARHKLTICQPAGNAYAYAY